MDGGHSCYGSCRPDAGEWSRGNRRDIPRYPYVGICESEAHKDWLQSHLLLTFMALAVDKKVPGAPIDTKLLGNVKMYLARAVVGVRIYIAAAKSSAYGDSYTGLDDSENEEE